MNVIETIFQVLFLGIMSIGILGLPLYFYLNARKKRIASEFDTNNEPEDDNTNDE